MPHADAAVRLTAEQEAAVAAVDRGGAHLLHGVTGSGKTEVYLRAAAAALERGEGVIVLVPEIALTPQTVGRFQARFGDTVALLHSALGEGERYDEWRRLRSGEARIAVGPRSAVFAPVRDLGLIVIDEEHDPSYKHEGDPRYDARSVAASACASRSAGREGDARGRPARSAGQRHAAPGDLARAAAPHAAERVSSRPLPPVRILDMRGARHPLHPDARRALGEARKAILLLNRRGWSNFLTCRDVRQGLGVPAVRRRARPAPRRGRRRRATTAATASGCPGAATRADRRRSPATARAPSGSRPSSSRRSTCPCSGSTPTPRAPRTRCRRCSRASRRRRRACSSARRWSPRAMTSRT